MVAPGGEKRLFEGALGGFAEEDVGAAFATPCAVAWVEGGRVSSDEVFLLEGSELDHSKLFVWISEGGEDFAGNAKVGVVHVFSFFGLREAAGNAPEVGGSGWHGALLMLSMTARAG